MFENSFFKEELNLNDQIKQATIDKDWQKLDALCAKLVMPGGEIFELLKPIVNQSRIEFIINVRDASNEWEEDGIWHDDGSRPLAFSLGLNINPSDIEGGILKLRKKGSHNEDSFSPIPYGEIIVFKTGVENYEHCVFKVTKGIRVVMAGWCYQ